MRKPDEYTLKVKAFLDTMPFDQTYTIDKLCIKENRPKFIAAIKLYINSYHYGAGVYFVGDNFEKIRRTHIPQFAYDAIQ